MEKREAIKKPIIVPQFGGWDQKAPGATDYSMVFTQARAKKKNQKTDLTEVKRHSLGNEQEFVHANHGHPHHAHGHGHGHAHANAHAHEDPVVVGKKKILTYINCCIRP